MCVSPIITWLLKVKQNAVASLYFDLPIYLRAVVCAL